MPNYFNPQSLNPTPAGLGWQPTGAMAGLNYMNQQNDYRKALSLQELTNQLDLQKQQLEFGNLQATSPSKVASDIATNEATTANIGNIKRGEGLSSLAKGEFDYKTLESRVTDMLGSNDEKTRQRGISALTHGMQVLDVLGPVVESGDKEAIKQSARSAGVSETNPFIQHILKSPNMKVDLDRMRSTLEGVYGRKEASGIKLKGDYGVEERLVMERAQNYTADQALAAAQYRSEHQQNMSKIEGIYTQALREYYAETDPVKKEKLAIKVNELYKQLVTLKAMGAPYAPSEFGADVLGGRTPNAPAAAAGRVGAIPPAVGGIPQNPQPPVQPAQGHPEGTIAVNPQTNQKIIKRNGQWVPYNG